MSLMVLEMPPPIKGPAPRLDTVNEIEVIIRKATESAETPISLNEIKRRMKAKAVRHSTVRAAVDHLKRMGCVWATDKGAVEWAEISTEMRKQPTFRLR